MTTNAQVLDAIFNAGERLVPGETHDRAEIVRHKSSYQLFRLIIETDIISDPSLLKTGVRILDIGCGTGHGTFMLGNILGAIIVGIDPSIESIQYAQENYPAKNIEYINNDAEAFVSTALPFDYVVSRHALEHVVDGLNFALKVVCHRRLMVNVPFNESEGNIHHKVHWIKEADFETYPNKEFLYEGLDGVTRLERSDDSPPNSIVCISSTSKMGGVRNLFEFPLPAWQPEFLQDLGINALDAGLAQLEVQLAARSAEAAQREVELATRAAEAAQREVELATWSADVVLREAGSIQREADIAQREANITQREANIAQREAELAGNMQRYSNLLLVRIFRKLRNLKI